MIMSKRSINLGHPDHGRGGKSGHQTVETHGRNVTRQKVKEKLERRQEKAERKKERNISSLMEKLTTDVVPKVNELYARIRKELEHGSRSKRTTLIKILAVNEWYIGEIERQLISKKISFEPLTKAERGQISLIDESDHRIHLAHLLGKSPTERGVIELQGQIDKWKKRVPKMLIGQY